MRGLFLMAAATLTWSAATQADNPINNPYQRIRPSELRGNWSVSDVLPGGGGETVILHTSCFFELESGGVGRPDPRHPRG